MTETRPKFEVRTGKNGKPGIFLTAWNVRVATFEAGTEHEQQEIAALLSGKKKKPHG